MATFLGPVSRIATALLLASSCWPGHAEISNAQCVAGIDGHYRVGRWTPLRLDASSDEPGSGATPGSPTDATWSIETRDGDGSVVTYQQPNLDGNESSRFGYFIPGGEAAPVVVRRGDNPLWQSRLPELGIPAKEPSMIPEGMPWVMVFGDPLGVETIGVNELLGREASITVTTVRDATILPDNAIGLRCIDLILITPSGVEALAACVPSQRAALAGWVLDGGQVLLSVGTEMKTLTDAAPWLTSLLPESVRGAGTVEIDPSGLEAFTNSQTRLGSFEAIALPKTLGHDGVGEAIVVGRTTRRISATLVARYSAGLGHITVLAGDLESANFARWPERLALVTRLGGDPLDGEREAIGGNVRLSGYTDLAGQTRRTLDQFAIQRATSFSVLAVIIVGLIALVAPLDYFVLRQRESRSVWGWVTFPLVALAISAGLIVAAQPRLDDVSASDALPASPASDDPLIRVNSLEFLDVDLASGFGRLFRWSFLYSHLARQLDLAIQPTAALRPLVGEIDHQLIAPFGYPGPSFGGIQIESTSGGARVVLTRPESSGKAGLISRIASLVVPPRSSQSLGVSMQFKTPLTSRPVMRRPGSELLQGELRNPLDVDLLDAMLIHRNWVYLLPTRFPAGSTIEELDRLRQKNFRWQLSRQRALESSSESEQWDVTASDDPRRLAEMLMFHEAVGGSRYTSLRHEILARLDFSDLLGEDRAILVGRLAVPWTELSIEPSDTPGPPITASGTRTSWARVVLEVQ